MASKPSDCTNVIHFTVLNAPQLRTPSGQIPDVIDVTDFQLDKQDVQSMLTDEWIRIDVQELAVKADTSAACHFELD
jgi:hypothetical protein